MILSLYKLYTHTIQNARTVVQRLLTHPTSIGVNFIKKLQNLILTQSLHVQGVMGSLPFRIDLLQIIILEEHRDYADGKGQGKQATHHHHARDCSAYPRRGCTVSIAHYTRDGGNNNETNKTNIKNVIQRVRCVCVLRSIKFDV